MREPDMVLHSGMTRIFGPVLTEQEFELLDEELAIGIIKFWEARYEEVKKEEK